MDSENFLNQIIPFTIITKGAQNSSPLQCEHTNRNLNWKSAYMIKQNLLLDVGSMVNIRFLEIEDFKYGSELSVAVSEFLNGPFIPIHTNKYFCRKKIRRILLSSLPCRFIRICSTKGVHTNPNNVKLKGSYSSEIASQDDNYEIFKLMVTNPQRIMYQ